MIARNVMQQSAKAARSGDLKASQAIAKTWNDNLKKCAESSEQKEQY